MERENDPVPGEIKDTKLVEEETETQETGPSEVTETVEAPVISEAELEALRQDLAEARLKASEYLDGWQRSRAEFANFKKRIEREQAQAHQVASGNIIKHFLDVLDDLERALKNRPQEGEGAVWANGIELIYRKLLTILENEGVKQMASEGQFFDPNLHEAISSEESDQHESGQIIEVLKHGYLLGDRILRPAAVRVAK